MKIKKQLGIMAAILTCISLPTFAQYHCPDLTTTDVQNVIDNGIISTDAGYTLANEAGVSNEQVIIDEPTANPLDTYFSMIQNLPSIQVVGQERFFVYVGNILGKELGEVRDRAKKILLKNESVFTGKYSPDTQMCEYKSIHASPSIPNYPFKSKYETVSLVGIIIQNNDDLMLKVLKQMKKNV